jgi:hypothetical protein
LRITLISKIRRIGFWELNVFALFLAFLLIRLIRIIKVIRMPTTIEPVVGWDAVTRMMRIVYEYTDMGGVWTATLLRNLTLAVSARLC